MWPGKEKSYSGDTCLRSWWGRKKPWSTQHWELCRSTQHGRGCLLLAHSLLAPHSGLAQSSPHWLPRYHRPASSPQVMPPCWHVPLPELELLGASPKEKSLQAGLVQLLLCESGVTSWVKSPSGGIILENETSSKWLHFLQFPIISLLFLSISFSLSHFKEATGQIQRCWPPN